MVHKLCGKLKEYQTQFISNKSMLATEQASVDQIVNKPLDLPLANVEDDDPAAEVSDGFS